MKFPPSLVPTGCSALGEDAWDSELAARRRTWGSVTCPQNPQMCKQMPFSLISLFFIGIGICYFSNKPLCTFGQIVATLDCLVRSSYPQLHGIINLIQILQGGLEIVLLSWWTFPLTDLHSAVHLCGWRKRHCPWKRKRWFLGMENLEGSQGHKISSWPCWIRHVGCNSQRQAEDEDEDEQNKREIIPGGWNRH